MAFTLETDRLQLRLRTPQDAGFTHELKGEHEGGTDLTREEVAQSLADQHAASLDNGIGFLTLTRKLEGDAIGYCGLFVGRGSFDEPEIAYELLKRVHGHGYATEAASAVVDAAFETGRERIWATVRSWNTPSFRVLDKLRFERDHTIVDEKGELVYLSRARA